MKKKNSITFVIGILYALGAISQTSDKNQINIGRYLSDGIEVRQEYGFTQKDSLDFDITQPLGMGNVPIVPGNIIARSILTKQLPGVGSQAQIFKNDSGQVVRFICTNLPLVHLYSFAFSKGKFGMVNFNRMILNLKDSAAYLQTYIRLENYTWWPIRSDSVEYERDWNKEHFFCYELAVPADQLDSFYSIMLNNLNNSCSLRGEIVKRNGRCWIIKATGKINPVPSAKTTKWDMDMDTLRSIQHLPISELVKFLNQIRNIVPVFDESGWNDPIDMSLHLPIHDLRGLSLNEIQRAISPYHLKITEEQRDLPFLYLTDRR